MGLASPKTACLASPQCPLHGISARCLEASEQETSQDCNQPKREARKKRAEYACCYYDLPQVGFTARMNEMSAKGGKRKPNGM